MTPYASTVHTTRHKLRPYGLAPTYRTSLCRVFAALSLLDLVLRQSGGVARSQPMVLHAHLEDAAPPLQHMVA